MPKTAQTTLHVTPEQAKAFAAELHKAAADIEAMAYSVESDARPDAYHWLDIMECLPVRVRIGREEMAPTAPRPLAVGAKVRVDYPGDGVVGPVTFWGAIEQVLESSCMVRSNHSNTCPKVPNRYITVIG